MSSEPRLPPPGEQGPTWNTQRARVACSGSQARVATWGRLHPRGLWSTDTCPQISWAHAEGPFIPPTDHLEGWTHVQGTV